MTFGIKTEMESFFDWLKELLIGISNPDDKIATDISSKSTT